MYPAEMPLRNDKADSALEMLGYRFDEYRSNAWDL